MVVADIGATKTVMAQALQSDGRIVLKNIQKYESNEAASFAAILEDYRGQYPFRANSSLCVGAAGPVEFYTQACGAVPIEGSTPGFYRYQRVQAEEVPDE